MDGGTLMDEETLMDSTQRQCGMFRKPGNCFATVRLGNPFR